MREGLAAAQALLPGTRLDQPVRLDSSERATVHRVRADDGTGSRTLIVKRYAQWGEGWVRETAALSVLPGGLGAPALLAAAADPPLLITTDAGADGSLADALMGDDPARAGELLRAWARALAGVHTATRDSRAAFRAALEARRADAPVHDTAMGPAVEDAVRVLDRVCASVGVPVPAGALEELRELNHRLGPDGAITALTPADTCPDDNAVTAGGLVLVDYENAQWRHVAWDVAYLRVPWPTCWCCWRIPSDVAETAVSAYRAAAAGAFPSVVDESFARDVDAATVGWCLMSATLFVDAALGDAPPLSGRYRRAPARRAMIQHRLERASRLAVLPAAGELAAALLAELRRRWGDVPLDVAPAFR